MGIVLRSLTRKVEKFKEIHKKVSESHEKRRK